MGWFNHQLGNTSQVFFQDFGELNQEAAGRNTSPKFRNRGTGARDFSACDGGGEKSALRLMVLRSVPVDTHLLIWRISHVTVRFHSSQVVIAGFQPSTLAFCNFEIMILDALNVFQEFSYIFASFFFAHIFFDTVDGWNPAPVGGW